MNNSKEEHRLISKKNKKILLDNFIFGVIIVIFIYVISMFVLSTIEKNENIDSVTKSLSKNSKIESFSSVDCILIREGLCYESYTLCTVGGILLKDKTYIKSLYIKNHKAVFLGEDDDYKIVAIGVTSDPSFFDLLSAQYIVNIFKQGNSMNRLFNSSEKIYSSRVKDFVINTFKEGKL